MQRLRCLHHVYYDNERPNPSAVADERATEQCVMYGKLLHTNKYNHKYASMIYEYMRKALHFMMHIPNTLPSYTSNSFVSSDCEG